MFIASQKRKENIAEYLLYMWQIEDLIRANGLDIDRIRTSVIDRFPGLDARQMKELTEWYESLIDMMRREEVAEKGHLQMNRNIINDMARLNNEVLADPDPKFEEYRREFYKTLPFIVELRAKSGDAAPSGKRNLPGDARGCDSDQPIHGDAGKILASRLGRQAVRARR